MTTQSKLIRYLIVGGGSYLIEMLALYMLRNVIGLSPVIAAAMSFWIGFVVAFVLQKYVTFKNFETYRGVVAKQALGYSLLVALNFGITLAAVAIFQHVASVFVIRTIVIALAMVWNFYAYHYIFKHNTGKEDERHTL